MHPHTRFRWSLPCAALLTLPWLASLLVALDATPPAAAVALAPGEILQELHAFQQRGRVLYVAAHPDDENTRLLATFAKGKGYLTGYLSLTRGDGGQNLVGPELRDRLGVIRTQELLAARRIDGAIQFFTRANDFGFSKNPDETFQIWNRREVLSDVVRVIRTFRPQVLITRFSPIPSSTHGHHTASAMLAVEAFKLAGDATAFPEQLADGQLKPWQPTRVLWNSWVNNLLGGNRKAGDNPPTLLQLDSGSYNPLLGESFGEIAARSRTQHKSQGFGTLATRGSSLEHFQVLAGEPATKDLFEGIDLTWSPLPDGPALLAAASAVFQSFDARDPAASVPALLALRSRLIAAAGNARSGELVEKQHHLDRIIAACLGLHLSASAPQAEVVPGESLKLTLNAVVRTAPANLALRWVRSRFPVTGTEIAGTGTLPVNQVANTTATATLPGNAAPSTPYWLREEGSPGVFRVDDPSLIGRPENPPVFPVEHELEIGGQRFVYADRVVQVIDDPVRGEIRRPLQVISPVSLGFVQELELFAPGGRREVVVEATAARGNLEGSVTLELPTGWSVTPASQPLNLASAGSQGRLTFTVTAPAGIGSGELVAAARIGEQTFRTGRADIRYEHIPAQLLQPRSQARVVSLDLTVRARTIGYLPGAGDLVAESLERMGCKVTTLGSADLTPERLAAFDAVVLGVRAFNTRADLGSLTPALFTYAERGGTVVVQYNTTADLLSNQLAPYSLKVSRDRITDELAPVTLLTPDHPALTSPNRITAADFEGWVQERGLYFPSEWDSRFTALLSSADAGESPKKGSLLVARHGKGHYVYTGLSFFRELPAGVPGAYRLFANLVSLGKP
ncbi:MAG: PIG-L family deacetylase [Opitutaceae bacterium]|nr:PIG-L family deacetylase [Opitutaceae bacterium]